MEIKKSYRADLDNRRASAFLLGLVVVLSVFLAALEFSTQNSVTEADDDMLDDVAQDIEMMPVIHRDDMIAAMQSSKPSAVSGKLNIVDKPVKDLADERPQADKDLLARLISMSVGGVTDIRMKALSPVTLSETDKPVDFRVVERLPEFPGGMSEFVQWLTKNLKYPVTAQRAKVQGTVLVSFIINKDGSTTAHKVVKSAAPELDREALRVLRMMPKWEPGEDRGGPCRTYFCIPIVFKI